LVLCINYRGIGVREPMQKGVTPLPYSVVVDEKKMNPSAFLQVGARKGSRLVKLSTKIPCYENQRAVG